MNDIHTNHTLFLRVMTPVGGGAWLLLLLWLVLLSVGPARAADFNVNCNVAELIAALTTASSNGEADVINLAAGCDYALTTSNNQAVGRDGLPRYNGLPVLTGSITINGNGATIRRASASNFRLLFVDSGGVVTLTNLTLPNGRLAGVTVYQTVTGGYNEYQGYVGQSTDGGGVYINRGQLTLADCTVTNHTASGGPGGDTPGDVAPGERGEVAWGGSASGGAIFNYYGTLTVLTSTLSYNTATGGNGGTAGAGGDGAGSDGGKGGDAWGGQAGGGAIYNHYGVVRVQASAIGSNTVTGGNGGQAGQGGGSVDGTGGDGGNGYGGNAAGGGLYSTNNSVTLIDTSFFNNALTGGEGGFGGSGGVGDVATGYGGDGSGGGVTGGGLYSEGDSLSLSAVNFISSNITGGDGGSGGDGGVGGSADGGSARGGGLYFKDGQAAVSGGSWQDNLTQGGKAGGGGYSSDNDEFQATLDGSAYGGGLAGLQSGATSGFTLSDGALFQRNRAKSEVAYGGGVYYGGSGGAVATLTGLQASHNHADSSAAALAWLATARSA
jgi:hypothetical protein